jgi:hypothetical protein
VADRVLPEGYARAAMEGIFDSATWANVMYFDVSTHLADPVTEVITLVASAMHHFYQDAVLFSNLPADWTTSWCKVTYRYSSSEQITFRIADATPGTHTGDPEPVQVCLLVNWLVGDPRRGGKPRTYLAGVVEGALSDDAHVDPAFAGGFNTRAATWLAGLSTFSAGGITGLSLVDMSFVDGKAPRAVGHPIPILGVAMNPVAATQRRRINRLRPA